MKPESVDVCLLYDPSDGQIKHVHRVATFAGAKKTSKQEVEARCLKHAKKLGHKTTKLKTLHLLNEDFKPSKHYRVDVQASKLIEQQIPFIRKAI
jgi:hypothetical protein